MFLFFYWTLCLLLIDLLELFILRLLIILCRICCRTFSLVRHLSLTLCSCKYFNLYFMYLGFMSCLRKPFLVQNYKAIFFCSVLYSVRLICLHLPLIHLEFITEFEVKLYVLFLKAEPTVPNCLLNNLLSISGWESPSHIFFWILFIGSFHTFIIPYTL